VAQAFSAHAARSRRGHADPDRRAFGAQAIVTRAVATARSRGGRDRVERRAPRLTRRFSASPTVVRDEALKVLLQNLLDSPLIAFIWGIGRCWSVRVDRSGGLRIPRRRLAGISGSDLWLWRTA